MIPEALIATCHSLSLPITDRPGLTVRSLEINEICNDRKTEKDWKRGGELVALGAKFIGTKVQCYGEKDSSLYCCYIAPPAPLKEK